MVKELDSQFKELRERPLTSWYKYIWLDAQYGKVRQDEIQMKKEKYSESQVR